MKFSDDDNVQIQRATDWRMADAYTSNPNKEGSMIGWRKADGMTVVRQISLLRYHIRNRNENVKEKN